MVHSALKRKRSSDGLSEEVSRGEAPVPDPTETSQESTIIDSSQLPPVDAIWEPLPDGFEDPRPTILALLSFLSDTELFTLITHRVAHAAPYRPPLYLTPFCICGMHDFFIPGRSATESFPDSAIDDSPFTKIPRLRDEKGHMGGKITGRVPKERAAAMLVSIATLLHFLTPQELRLLIQARVATSEAPHQGVRWFLEFMSSGGDGVPRGKRDLDQRKSKMTKKREEQRRLRVEKRLVLETGKNEGATHPEAGPVLGAPPGAVPTSVRAHTPELTKVGFPLRDDDGQEEGEITPGTSSYIVEQSSRRKPRSRRKKKSTEQNRDGQAFIIHTVEPPPPFKEYL